MPEAAKVLEKNLGELHREFDSTTAELETTNQTCMDILASDDYISDDDSKRAAKHAELHAAQHKNQTLLMRAQGLQSQITLVERSTPVKTDGARKFRSETMKNWLSGADMAQEGREMFLAEPTQELKDYMEREVFASLPAGLRPGKVGDIFCPMGAEFTMGRGDQPFMAATDPYRSDTNTSTNPGGSDARPTEWSSEMVQRLAYAGNVPMVARNFSTSHGNDYIQPALDSSGEKGGKVTDQTQTAGEGIQGDDDPIPHTTAVTYKSSWRHSNFMPVRIETFTDLIFDAAGHSMEVGYRRLGRGWNEEFTIGATGGAQGLIQGCKVMDSTGNDTRNKITWEQLVDLEYEIDRAYRVGNEGMEFTFYNPIGGMVCFMIHEEMEKILRKAVDSNGRPIWSPNLEMGRAIQGAPGMIGKYPYVINNDLQDGADDDDISILFGNFGHYWVRNCGAPMFFRFFDSGTMRKWAHEMIALSRRDGRYAGPIVSNKCEAIVGFQHAAS